MNEWADLKIDELEEQNRELTALVRAIPNRTKHGPGGKGGDGPCDADCLKCRAIAWLSAHGVAS